MADQRTDRAVVKTYVPPDQKQQWTEHAEDLDMSQSEFLRTMVQAGRRDFLSDVEEGGSPDANPRGGGLEDRVLESLSADEVVTWDELVATVSGDLEDRLDETIQSLTEAGQIRHDPREGGYTLPEDA
ncbi:DUF5805 domain-containing protein [Halobacterium zhouii]|uniref:DUF5805 domain-containing protein n=1 Tax=Halobacterium zhouii TaxID=2902624 RepID=UPI001E28E5BE|nr:DUF5805 domain-containing protein [Halobacterium zhouii]